MIWSLFSVSHSSFSNHLQFYLEAVPPIFIFLQKHPTPHIHFYITQLAAQKTTPKLSAEQQHNSCWLHVSAGATQIWIKSKVLVAQSRPTLCNPMNCSSPGSSVHGILQARILQWVLPDPGTQVSCIAGRFFTIWANREALSYEYFGSISCTIFTFRDPGWRGSHYA